MEIRDVAVIGLGTMGAGIAEVFARAGLPVTAVEVDHQALERGMTAVSDSLSRAVARGRLTGPEQEQILARVRPAAAFAEVAGADLVVEVVPERMDIKRQVFTELDRACRDDAILATNTSSLSVTAIAAQTRRPDRVVGMHFFNPAPVMRLVEVVSTVLTSAGTVETVTGLARRLGKTPVTVADRAGFAANALLLPYLNHAAVLLGNGHATRDDIDAAMRLGAGLPMGPLALLDLIGLDTSLSVLEVLAAEFGGTRYTAAPLLRRLTDAGLTGRKSGRGFYDYREAEGAEPAPASPAPAAVTLIGYGDAASEGGGEAGTGGVTPGIGAMAEAAGIIVRRAASGPDVAGADLLIVPAGPEGGVLRAAIAAGAPQAVGLHLADGKVAEVVVTATTASLAGERASGLARLVGLTPVRSPDRPGLLVSALLYPHLNDAVRMLEQDYASAADIDTAMTLGCGYPRGPLEMADGVGARRLQTVLAAMHGATGDPAYAPAALLAEHATAGLAFRADGGG